MTDPLIFSFNDSSIYQSDINLIKSSTTWLNDSIISFYLEWLKENKQTAGDTTTLLLSPSVIFCCSFVDSEQEIQSMFEQPLKLKSREIIFFPLTNNRDPSVVGGGSHWSLLIFIKSINKFLYYDSINRFDASDALFVISKFKFLLSSCSNNLKEYIINKNTPRQQNGYDCGVYVLSIIEELLKCETVDQLISNETEKQLIEKIKPNFIKEKRVEILNIINNIAAKK